jgi:hypothetical protein
MDGAAAADAQEGPVGRADGMGRFFSGRSDSKRKMPGMAMNFD